MCDNGHGQFDAKGGDQTTSHAAARGTEPEVIVVSVGKRDFKATRKTLVSGSEYFAKRIEEGWCHDSESLSYFVDRDPDLFTHILEFLRSGRPPLFFDFNTHVFDLVRYQALLVEARFFGMPKLEGWVAGKKYLRSITIERSITVVPDLDNLNFGMGVTLSSNDRNVKVSTGWVNKKVAVCPRNIAVHRGDLRKCGQACHRRRDEQGGEIMFEDEAVPTGIVISTKVELDPTALMGEG
ncbi:hypothetical protein F4809DRAFT_623968 [Biscogniauxia mediterranea]|nr:hypothetical protein F4809DRAFT_623968 [Biscogniauxia mediterranea]